MVTPNRDEIIALEKDYWEAMKRKDGRRTAQLSGDGALNRRAWDNEHPKGQNEGDDRKGGLDTGVVRL